MSELICKATEPGTWLIYPAVLADRVQGCWFDREYWGDAAQPLSADRGGRSAPLLLPTDPGPSVWRHYQRGGAVAKLFGDRYLWTGLQRTRPWREMQVNWTLYNRGVRVPRPLLARICREGRWYRGDLLTEQIAQAQTLAQRWSGDALTPSDWSRVGVAVAELHQAGCDHADLNAHNLLIDSQQQIWTLDFDRAVLRAPGQGWRQANLQRLQRSLIKVGGQPPPALWQSLLEAYRERFQHPMG